jgi:NAD(P)-dependent dehydrogenase (short-subunit alcohol dehydrogenase family)
VTERRSVVITGASRGLGLASASRLYCAGWTVVAAMRSVDAGWLGSERRSVPRSTTHG